MTKESSSSSRAGRRERSRIDGRWYYTRRFARGSSGKCVSYFTIQRWAAGVYARPARQRSTWPSGHTIATS